MTCCLCIHQGLSVFCPLTVNFCYEAYGITFLSVPRPLIFQSCIEEVTSSGTSKGNAVSCYTFTLRRVREWTILCESFV
jgi:hypothetical protein